MKKKLIRKGQTGYVAPELHNTGVEIGANNPKIGNAVKTGFYMTPVFGTALSAYDFMQLPNLMNGLGLMFSLAGDVGIGGVLAEGSKLAEAAKAERNARIALKDLRKVLRNSQHTAERARNKVESATLSDAPINKTVQLLRESNVATLQAKLDLLTYNKMSKEYNGTYIGESNFNNTNIGPGGESPNYYNNYTYINRNHPNDPRAFVTESPRELVNHLYTGHNYRNYYPFSITDIPEGSLVKDLYNARQAFNKSKHANYFLYGIGKSGAGTVELARQNSESK